jgi:hypothetical protein
MTFPTYLPDIERRMRVFRENEVRVVTPRSA